MFIFLGYIAGFLGISLGLYVYLSLLADTKSFGVPYTVGLSSLEDVSGSDYYLPPIWKREQRSSFINPKKKMRQDKISMKWKFK